MKFFIFGFGDVRLMWDMGYGAWGQGCDVDIMMMPMLTVWVLMPKSCVALDL